MLRKLACPQLSYRSGNADGLARLGCAKAEKDKGKW